MFSEPAGFRGAGVQSSRRPALLGFAGLLLVLVTLGFAAAEEKKDEVKKPEPPKPPRVALVLPLGVEAGASNRLTIRGQFLTNRPAVKWAGADSWPEVKMIAVGDAKKIEGLDAARVGDQQIEVEFELPRNLPVGTNAQLIVISPVGESAPFPLWVASAGGFVDEQEPNNGFRKPASAPRSDQFIRGSLSSVADVDLFQFDLRSGETLQAEVWAARLGSTLDASLTVYDHRGATLLLNDDGPGRGRDPFLEFTARRDGRYYLAIVGVTERGGDANVYLLRTKTGGE